MYALVLALLVLNPVLEEAGPVRLASSGTGLADVEWTMDGGNLAVTGDGAAAIVELPAGSHRLEASTPHDGPWRILARPDAPGVGGAAFVEAWTASSGGEIDGGAAGPEGNVRSWSLWLAAVAGTALVLWPRRGVGPKHS